MPDLIDVEPLVGQQVRAYRNLRFANQRIYSIKQKRLVGYTDSLYLTDVLFVIQPSEQARARRIYERNVHAYADGVVRSWQGCVDAICGQTWKRCTYNPFKHDTFVDWLTEQPITSAAALFLGDRGSYYVEGS